uniref:Uncharacterized protein n=1 Tax=Anguilla anguilla TaxID=7936 RepID=A0A0E9TK99_ANGAN
MMGCPYRQKQH